jgi:hypothetical protein
MPQQDLPEGYSTLDGLMVLAIETLFETMPELFENRAISVKEGAKRRGITPLQFAVRLMMNKEAPAYHIAHAAMRYALSTMIRRLKEGAEQHIIEGVTVYAMDDKAMDAVMDELTKKIK